MRKLLFSLLLAIVCSLSSFAVPSLPGLCTYIQPDGSSLTIQLIGDEFLHYTTTADGYTIDKNEDGFFVYMHNVDGNIIKSNIVAHNADCRSDNETAFLSAIQKGLIAEQDIVQANAARIKMNALRNSNRVKDNSSNAAGRYDYTKFRGLVILAEFNDQAFSRDDIVQVYTDMLSQKNYKGIPSETTTGSIDAFTGSVRDYFFDNSLGKFDPEFDVIGPVKVDVSKTYPQGYANGPQLAEKVIRAADPLVDYSKYCTRYPDQVDLIYIIYAGHSANYGANDKNLIWPHAHYRLVEVDGVYANPYACSNELLGSSLTSKKFEGIGTICHEFSHVLGLQDEYDVAGNGSFHPGEWSIMAGGSYKNNGRTPVGYSALHRLQAGFSEPKATLNKEGEYSLPPIDQEGEFFRMESGADKESFLFEVRSKNSKWDKYILYKGMLVFRVDSTNVEAWSSNRVNSNPAHNYYEMVRAKPSAYNSPASGDAFPGSGKITSLTNDTEPANLLSWGGKRAPFVLKNITIDTAGTVHFSLEKDSENSGIESIAESSDSPFRAIVQNGEIKVISNSDEPIQIYNTAGCLISTTPANQPITTPPSCGLYIIRQGAYSEKIVI